MKAIQRLKNLIKLDKKDIYQIFLYSIFGGLISLTLPLGVQSIVNFIQAGKVSTSWIILVGVVVIGVILVGIFKVMQFRISENLQQKIFVRSSFEFTYRFPKIKFNNLYNQYPPELANRFFDTLSVQKGLSKLLLDISTALLQIVFGLILLSLYHPFFIVFGVLLAFSLYFIFKVNYSIGLKTSLKESNSKYRVAHWIQEIARNHISFKNQKLFEFSLNKNDALVNEYLSHRENHFSILKRQFIQLIGFKTVITAGLLILGGLLVMGQQMNIGQFVAAEIIILTIINAVEKLFGGLELFYDVLTSLEKLGNVVDLEIDEHQTSHKSRVNDITLELRDVSYKYPDSENYILKKTNLIINQGNKIIISGSNGAGKTTLMRILGAIIEPSTGTLFVNGIPSKNINTKDFRKNVAHITATNAVFEGTILENLTFYNDAITSEQINEVLDFVKLTDYIKNLTNGLDTIIYSEGRQISSSAAQKIVLARMLLLQPKVLIIENALNKIEIGQAKEIISGLIDKSNPFTFIYTTTKDLDLPNNATKLELINGQLTQK